jgi:hypothetical protein
MRFLFSFLAALVSFGLSGCAGYRLGPTNGETVGARTIEVRPFLNETMEPRLGDEVTAAVRRQLQHDGTYRLATQGDADIVVTGVVLRYTRRELSLVPNDVLTVQDYRVNARMHLTARTRAGKPIFDNTIDGYTLVRVGSDLPSAERQALPLLAEDLAKNVTAVLVDGSW